MGHLDREAQGLYAYIRQASVESIAYFHAVYGVASPSRSTPSADPKHLFSTQSQRALRAQGFALRRFQESCLRLTYETDEQRAIGKLLEIIRDYCSFSAMFADVAYAFYHQGISQVSESLMLRRTHSGWSTHGLVLHKPAPPRPLTRCICEPVLTVSVSYRTTYSPPPKFSSVFTGYMLIYL